MWKRTTLQNLEYWDGDGNGAAAAGPVPDDAENELISIGQNLDNNLTDAEIEFESTCTKEQVQEFFMMKIKNIEKPFEAEAGGFRNMKVKANWFLNDSDKITLKRIKTLLTQFYRVLSAAIQYNAPLSICMSSNAIEHIKYNENGILLPRTAT